MTTNTLQLARLDSPKVDITFNWESVEEILGTVCLRSRRNHPMRTIETRLPEHLPLLSCDAVLMNQLFDNLIDNGLRHSETTTPLLLSATCVDKRLYISVQDKGCGIPDEWKSRVFDIFQRVDTVARPVDGGARRGIGIGLAVCRAIADVHGGTLEITDTLGGGTTVTLCLPIAEQPRHPLELDA
jgi:two-component system sensor histidine kinase KdpD